MSRDSHRTVVPPRVASRAVRAALAVAVLVSAVACAGHSARTQQARSALDAGRPQAALELYNEALGVGKAEDLPQETNGDNALLLLDRAVILQSLRKYDLSSRDLQVADKQIELLDFSRGALDDIGKYVFSDDTGPYKAPLYEKLLINTLNMVNYLVRRDLSGAKVEARRLAVMQKHIRDTDGVEAALTGPGSYLAGFAFEKAGEPDIAMRYYDEALQYGDFKSLSGPIQRLAKRSSYRTKRLSEIIDAAPNDAVATDQQPDKPAELLVVVNYGRVPAKFAKRIPIGLALTIASGHLSAGDRSRANHLAGQGLVTWVNYPELGKPTGSWQRPGFQLDGKWQTLEGALAVDREVRKTWDDIKGSIIAAAIVRTITRVVAGEAVRGGSNDTGRIIASLATQALLTAADTPDTRSWATLPARIAISRITVPPGEHEVLLSAGGRDERFKVRIKPGDWAVVNLTVLR